MLLGQKSLQLQTPDQAPHNPQNDEQKNTTDRPGKVLLVRFCLFFQKKGVMSHRIRRPPAHFIRLGLHTPVVFTAARP